MGRSDIVAPSAPFILRALGAASFLLWVGFALVSHEFAYGTISEERPFGVLSAIVLLAFVYYLAALWVGRARKGRTLGGREVLLLAVLMRLPLLLFSHPVQEIDFYRYLWDGRSSAEGVSPYRFSPADLDRMRAVPRSAEANGTRIEGASAEGAKEDGNIHVPPSAGPLLSLLERSRPMETIFLRIDHREVPTVYPVMAQAVFAAAAWVTPEEAPVFVHMAVLRAILTLFDLGTVILLLFLGKRLRLPLAFAIAYAWCPLVLKEFANASHMDVIPVFFTVAAFTALALVPRSRPVSEVAVEAESARSESGSRSDSPGLLMVGNPHRWVGIGFVLLVLAIFAKWYPVVLLPVFLSFAWSRGGGKGLAASIPGFVLAFALALVTLQPDSRQERARAGAAEAGAAGEMSGLQTFLTRWEMNDLLFSVVRENLRVAEPGENYGARPEPWYAFTPPSWREGWNRTVRGAAAKVGREGAIPAPDFLGAQLLCGGMLALLIAGLSLRRWETGPEGVRELGRALFLVLAASWYLSATQNPWYWAWALPFLGFARSRIWWLVSGCALIYYARFWLIYQFPEPFWRGYDGRRFFDEIVVWFEHGPVLVALAVAAVRERHGP